jgi:hypothetical protein
MTDQAAAEPWQQIGRERIGAVHRFRTALSTTLTDTGQMSAVTPVGAPWPPPTLRTASHITTPPATAGQRQ